MVIMIEKNGKTTVGIIMGGLSSEREVSLESGRNIFNKISRNKYEPIAIFMDGKARFWEIDIRLLMRNSTSDIEEDLETHASRIRYEELKAKIDVACLALHGKYGEDGCIQGLLELLHIPYTGSGVLASALGMDKYFCRRLLAARGIPVPASQILSSRSLNGKVLPPALGDSLLTNIGYPCIVKPAREGCSTGVCKVNSKDELPQAIKEAFLWDSSVLIEEFITGMEVTCGVIEDQGQTLPLMPSETVPTAAILSLEDKFLYGRGENKTPARLPGETLTLIQEMAVRTFETLGLHGYARIDMFVRPDGSIVVLEPNTLPGMTPSTVLFHQAAASGITPTEMIDRIIMTAISLHNGKKGPL